MSIRSHFSIGDGSIAYCYIRKNACSAFKRLISGTSPYALSRRTSATPMKFMGKHHRIYRLERLKRCKRAIVVLRDPVERAVSGFLNPFVLFLETGEKSIHGQVTNSVRADLRDLSFRDFVLDYLVRTPTPLLNNHFWPQISHLAPIVYTDAVLIHDLPEKMTRVIGEELAKKYFSVAVNRTSSSSGAVEELEDAGSIPAGRLLEIYRETGQFPGKRAFLSDDLISVIAKMYAWDYRLINLLGCKVQEGDADDGSSALDMRNHDFSQHFALN